MEILKQIPIFSELNEQGLTCIAQLVKYKTVGKGEFIFHEGDKGENFFFIQTGKIKLYKTSSDGKQMILNFLDKGNIFAEVTILTGIPYPATAQALTESVIGMILNADLEKVMIENGELALELIKIMSAKLYTTTMKLSQFILSDTMSRVSSLLLDLVERHGKMTKNGIVLRFDMTRQDFAAMVGTTRETATRVISKLKKENVIAEYSDGVLIKDMDKLKDYAEQI